MLKARLSDRPPAKKQDNQKKSKKLSINKINLGSLKRNIFYIFLSVLFLLIGLSFVAPMFINLKVWKPEIVSTIEEYSGKKAVINGDINFSLYPYPQIVTENIIIYDDFDNNKQFFSSDVIKAQVSLLPLIAGNIEIDKIIFENINIYLDNTKNQDPNWVFTKALNEGEINEYELQYQTFDFPNIEIKKYEIVGGMISLTNDKNSYIINIEKINLNTENEYNSASGKIEIDNIKLDISGNLSKSEEQYNLSLSMFNEDLKIIFDGEIKYESNFPFYKGGLKIDLTDTEALANVLEKQYIGLIKDKTKFDSNIELNFKNRDLFYSLDNINITSDSTILTGAISGNGGTKPTLNIVLSSNNFNLDAIYENLDHYLSVINNDTNPNSDTSSSLSQFNGSLLLSIGTSKLLEYPVRDIVIDLKKINEVYKLENAKAIFPGNTEISFNGEFIDNFKVFNGNSKLDSDNIKLFGKWLSFDFANLSDSRFKKTSISSSVVFRKGGATFAGLNGTLDSSQFDGEIRLRFSEENNLSAKVKIDQVNIDAYIEDTNNQESKYSENNFINLFDDIVLDLEIDKILYADNSIEGVSFSTSYKNQNLNIRNLEVNNYKKGNLLLSGDINYMKKDPIYDLSFSYENNNFISFLEQYKSYNFINKILVNNGKVEGVFNGKKDSLSSNVKFENENIEINYDGNINYLFTDNVEWDGLINGQIKNIYQFLDNENININIENYGIYDYAANIYFDQNTLQLENINLKNNEVFYEGRMSVDYIEPINISADINANMIRTDNFFAFDYILKDYFSENLLGEFQIKSDRILFLNNVFDDFSGEIKIKKDSIIFQDFEGKIFNSKLVKSSSYDKLNNIFKSEIKISKGDINLLLDNYFNNNAISGKFSSKFEIDSFGIDINEIIKNFKGNGNIKFRDIFVEKIDLLNALEINNASDSYQNFDDVFNESVESGNNTKIDNIDLELIFENGKFTIDSSDISIDKYNGLFSAEYYLFNNNLTASLMFPQNEENTNKFLLNLITNQNTISYIIDVPLKNEDLFEGVDSLNNEIVEQNIDSEELENSDIDNNNIDNNMGFDEILNDLAFDTLQENVIENENNNLETLEKYNKLIEPVNIILSYNNINYDRVANKIVNNIVKPKLPTQEEILDDMLDTLLGSE